MPVLLLIRHGENDLVGKRLAGRMPGVHLNDRGRQQAERVALALEHAPIRAVYSSPLERAVETAAPLARLLGQEVQVRQGLIEIDFGAWQGFTGKQMRRARLWKAVQTAPSQVVFPQGESFSAAQARMAAEVSDIAASHEEKDLVAIYSHADSIRLTVAHFLGLPLDNFQRLSIDTASITVLMLGKEGAMFGPINMSVHYSLRVDLAPIFAPPPPAKPEVKKTHAKSA